MANKGKLNMNPIVLQDLEDIHTRFTTKNRLLDSSIIVTGAGGFLGYYLSKYFVSYKEQLGIKKIVLLDPAVQNEEHWLNEYINVEGVVVISSKVEDLVITEIIENTSPVFIVHAASIASPTFYRQFPITTIDANIWGLRSLLEQCKSLPVKGFLFYSSSEIYGDPLPDEIPTNEEYRGNVSCLGPRACYDESKRFGETISWVFHEEYGIPITIARPFNNYGPGMSPADRRLPADLASKVLNQEDIELYSKGSPTRTFCYVSDAVVGYLKCLVHGKFDYFNIGNDSPELSVSEFAEIFRLAAAEVLGYKGDVVYATTDDPAYLVHNPQRRCPDLTKAKKVLDYETTVSVEEGVKRYLEFLKWEEKTK
jgi:UDP-glucuronate decarboxylase